MEMLVFVAASIAAQFVAAAAFMFGVGAIHEWLQVVPSIGYVESCVIVISMFVLSLLGTFGLKATFS